MATKKKSKGIPVDFTGSEGGGGTRWRVAEGDYKMKIIKTETGTSGTGNAKIVVTMKGLDGAVKGREIKAHLALTTKALWKVRQLMEAIGMEVPTGKGRIDIAGMVGEEVGVTLGDADPYEGKINSEVKLFLDPEAVDEEPEDDEEEEEEDEEEEEEEDDDLGEMSRAELKAYIQSNELDVKVKKSMSTDDIVEAIKAAAEDDEELEDIDLDEEM